MKYVNIRALLYLAGFVLIFTSAYTLVYRNNPNRITVQSVEDIVYPINSEKRIHSIEIGSINVNLPLVESLYAGEKWQTSDKGVSYLATSPVPGEAGNSIMYGHNWGSILGNLNKVKIGDVIRIYFTDNSIKDFKVDNALEVYPNDNSLLLPTKEARITIYTCSGIFDQKRYVVTASLI